MRMLIASLTLSLAFSASAATLKVDVNRNGFTGPIEIALAPRVEDRPPEWMATKKLAADQSVATFSDLASGLYFVLARGPEPLQRLSAKANLGSDGGTLHIALPRSRTALRVTLGGQPLARASVELVHDALRWETELTTNAEGRFEGALWEPGLYTARVQQDRTAAPHIADVTLSPQPLVIDVPDRHVGGRVLGDDGKPLAGALVTLQSESPRSTLTVRATTAADGSFEFFGVREGAQRLTARAPSYLLSDAAAFELQGPHARHAQEIRLARGTQHAVRVVDARGGAIANATLYVACDGNIKSITMTNADGRASIASPDSPSCTVYALPKEGSMATQRVEAAKTLVIRVPAGSSSLHLALKSDNGAAFSGMSLLMRVGGNVVSPAMSHQLARAGFSLVTDEQGSISLANIPPGSYEFWPYRTEAEGRMLYETAPDFAAPITLNVVTGENNATVRFKARR